MRVQIKANLQLPKEFCCTLLRPANFRIVSHGHVINGRMTKLFIIVVLVMNITACTSLFFLPSKTLVRTPGDLKLDYEDVFLTTQDNITVHGWWIQPPSRANERVNKTPTGRVLFLHGNAENISTHIASVLWLLNHGYQIFALDYRGYGLSQGAPDVPEVFEDIRAATQWLSTQPSHGRSFIFAQSLGASLAFGALRQYPEIAQSFDGIISEAAFSEYDVIAREVASKHWLTWPLGYPASWLIPGTYDPLSLVDKIELPKLFVHSIDDRVVGIHHTRKLHALAKEPKRLIETTGAHISAIEHAEVREQILLFMNAGSLSQ